MPVFSLPDFYSYQLILGGDFSCCLNPALDHYSRNAAMSKSAKVIQAFHSQYAVSDPWRFLNPTARENSFFSPVHHTFPCIDYFLFLCG